MYCFPRTQERTTAMTISRRLARGDKRCLGTLACGHPTFAGLSRLCCCHRCDMGGNTLSNHAISNCQTSGQLIPRPCYAPSIRVHVQPFVGHIHGLAGLLERPRLTCMVRAWRCGIRLSKIKPSVRFVVFRKPLRVLPNLPEPPWDVK